MAGSWTSYSAVHDDIAAGFDETVQDASSRYAQTETLNESSPFSFRRRKWLVAGHDMAPSKIKSTPVLLTTYIKREVASLQTKASHIAKSTKPHYPKPVARPCRVYICVYHANHSGT